MTSISTEDFIWELERFLETRFYTLEGSLTHPISDSEDAFADIRKSIRHCSFNKEPCREQDFVVVDTEAFGKCLAFNYKGDKEVNRSNSRGTGEFQDWYFKDQGFFKGMKPSEGLQLLLTSYASNDVTLLSPTEGFRLSIHSPGTEPSPLEEGFDINMQTISYVGMRKVEFERIHTDVRGNCAFDSYLVQRFDPTIFKITEKTKYSKQLCLRLCFFQKTPEAESCLDHYILRSSKNKSKNCNDTSLKEVWKKSYEKVFREDGFCGCPPQACTEEKLQWSFSSVQMGRENALRLDLLAWMRNEKRENMSASELKNKTFCRHFKENLAGVNVYYENMAVEKTVEKQMYPWTSFIGTLGGMLGLYTGLSFVSLLEVLEWILDLFLYGWRKPLEDNTGPKPRVILTWMDSLEEAAEPRNTFLQDSGLTWRDRPVYVRPSAKESRRAGFNVAFSDRFS
ncbi:unnamed protein product [Darwinula stevensoni]|uniref:Uncharacterized protein n=1 Tax=Darwinula stevensoni TaxID=69355 RepID=A0A7R8XCQ1_9CRUS|nr:unnamed protein product [Darwinula stevensoni]CAG0892226.1 unnamed protein product [Darwinula stevensoni]